MARGGKREGAGRPKGSTREKKAVTQLVVTQQTLGADDPLLKALEGLGDDYDALDFLRKAYRCKEAPLDVRFVAAKEAVKFERAKPSANKGSAPASMVFNFGRHAKSA